MTDLHELPIDKVHPNGTQPRQQIGAEALQELADSIRDLGLIQPILVRPNADGWQIIHGERRWRACKLAGLETIRAEVRDLGDDEAYTISVVENEQREDLSPIETAQALVRMMEGQQLTQSGAARRISRSRSWVAQKVRLLGLPGETQERVKAGTLTEGHARQLLKLEGAGLTDQIDAIGEQAATEQWSVLRLQSEVDTAIVGDAPERENDGSDLSPEDAIAAAFWAGVLCVTRHACLSRNSTVSQKRTGGR